MIITLNARSCTKMGDVWGLEKQSVTVMQRPVEFRIRDATMMEPLNEALVFSLALQRSPHSWQSGPACLTSERVEPSTEAPSQAPKVNPTCLYLSTQPFHFLHFLPSFCSANFQLSAPRPMFKSLDIDDALGPRDLGEFYEPFQSSQEEPGH